MTKQSKTIFNYKNKVIGHIAIVVVCVFVFFTSLGTVGAGQRGVRLRFSAPTGMIVGEGLYFKLPIIEKVVIIDVKTQKEQTEADAASKDLQTVKSEVAVNFHINPEQVVNLYRNVGVQYKTRIIDPALQEAVKATTANFTAEELITKREEVREEISAILQKKLLPFGLNVDAFNIVNFDFSPAFNGAIEAKVTAEQNALAAKNKLEQVRFEAEQRITQAKGEAEAIRIQAQAITQQGGAEYVNLKSVEKWNGTLPQYMMGNSVPFINLK